MQYSDGSVVKVDKGDALFEEVAFDLTLKIVQR